MNRNSKWMLILTLTTVALAAVAQQVVNQGKPGTQGPWPITGTISTVSASPDGGTTVRPAPCGSTSTHTNVSVGTASTTVPAAQVAGRYWVQICNSLQNGGSAQIKCRADAVAPVFASGNAGDVLNTGDCVQYALTSAIAPLCIANGAGTNVTTFQCAP